MIKKHFKVIDNHELNNLSRPLKSVTRSCFKPRCDHEYARLEYWIFAYLPFGHSKNKFFKEYFFSGIVDFWVPFSINFLSSSAFLGFRKALEQDAISSLVSVVRSLETRVRF